jgi:enoyl-CoA hydratase/carnithine racemase
VLTRAVASLEVLSLDPGELTAAVPAWETRVAPGVVAVTVIDGPGAAWAEAAAAGVAALGELRSAPVLTIAVVRDGDASGAAQELVHACDLVLAGSDELDHDLGRLLERLEPVAAPVLVAAQLLRAGDAGLAGESFAYSMLLGGEPFREWRNANRRGDPEDGWAGRRVEVEELDGTPLIRLTRPRRHNAYDARMREHLCDALDAITAPGVPVVLVGEGPSFCSGGDLDEFGRATDPLGAHVVRNGRSVARRLERISDRLVVGVHGHCIGAGVELAAFARTVIAAAGTHFALPELRLGLSLGAGGSVSIPRRIGRHRTLELLIGEPIDDSTALAWGLVDEVAGPDELEARCLEAAAELR